jgi:hypothetical protein
MRARGGSDLAPCRKWVEANITGTFFFGYENLVRNHTLEEAMGNMRFSDRRLSA